jgi:hypothetical protein
MSLPRRLIVAALLAVMVGSLVLPAPAYAADPITVTVVEQQPTTQGVRVKIRIENKTDQRLTLTYKRVPDGATSRDITLSPMGATGDDENETVRLSCNTTSTLEFTYWFGDRDASATYKYDVKTGACASAGPDGQPADDSGSGDNSDGIDIHFADFFKKLGKWALIVVGGLAALLLGGWIAIRRFISR